MSQALGNNLQPRVATGTFIGTAATIVVDLEFTPRYVYVLNRDGLAKMEWSRGMAQASAIKQITAGTMSEITTLGITVNEKFTRDLAGDGPGFEIGADTDVNVAAEEGFWMAIE